MSIRSRIESLLDVVLPEPELPQWRRDLDAALPALVVHVSNLVTHYFANKEAQRRSDSDHLYQKASFDELGAKVDRLQLQVTALREVVDPTPPEVRDEVERVFNSPAVMSALADVPPELVREIRRRALAYRYPKSA